MTVVFDLGPLDEEMVERASAAAAEFAAKAPPPVSREEFVSWVRSCVSEVMRQTEPGAHSTYLN